VPKLTRPKETRGELVKTVTADGLILDGFLAPPRGRTAGAFIFIHGLGSNFYRHSGTDFIQPFHRINIAVLLANTRGHDMVNRMATTKGERRTFGATHERLSESHYDLDGWIRFAERRGFNRIFLCGHSLGAVKVGLYVRRGKRLRNVRGAIYASPPDMWNENYRAVRQSRGVAVAKKLRRTGKGGILMPKGFMKYDQTVESYLDKMDPTRKNNIFNFVKREFPWAQKFKRPQLLIYGDHDEPVKNNNPKTALAVFQSVVPHADTICIKGANHNYAGKRRVFYSAVARWVKNVIHTTHAAY